MAQNIITVLEAFFMMATGPLGISTCVVLAVLVAYSVIKGVK